MDNCLRELLCAFDADTVLTGGDVNAIRSSFWDSNPLQAKAYVRPRNTDEVSTFLKICYKHRQTVVPHGGTTGLVSGAASTENDVVLSLARMNAIEDISLEQSTVTVEAGAILQRVQEAADESDMYFPIDFGARGSCTIGGNISTNAGGNNVIRYGMMRQQVVGLEAVLADGTIVSSMTEYLKNNAGYDLKQLFIGAEGTLGIVTRAVLRLAPKTSTSQTAILGCGSFSSMSKLLNKFRNRFGPFLTSFEFLDNSYFNLNTGIYSKIDAPIANDYPYYVLIEISGDEENCSFDFFAMTISNCLEIGLLFDAVIAKNYMERMIFWHIRENIDAESQRHENVFGYDVSLPIRHIEQYCHSVRSLFCKSFSQGIIYMFGHLGDGNLHLTAGDIPPASKADLDRIIYEPLRMLGGSISAEHGIGLDKKSILGISRTESEIAMMRILKSALDPRGILNRGKVFD